MSETRKVLGGAVGVTHSLENDAHNPTTTMDGWMGRPTELGLRDFFYNPHCGGLYIYVQANNSSTDDDDKLWYCVVCWVASDDAPVGTGAHELGQSYLYNLQVRRSYILKN